MHETRHSPPARRPALRLRVLALGLALGVVGCFDSGGDEQPPPVPLAALQVSWRITTYNLACDSVGLQSVRLELTGTGRTPFQRQVPCSQGSLLVQDLPAGPATLTLHGLDAADKTTYRTAAQALPLRADTTEVVGPLNLARLPATLHVDWAFANGLRCGSNGVEFVDLTIFDLDLQREVLPTTRYDCDVLTPPVLELAPGRLELIASGIGGGRALFADTEPITLAAEQEASVLFRLQACPPGSAGTPGC